MIVIDPVVTDTAALADFHLRVKPGSDAWCLAALAAVLVQENLCDEAFLADHVNGADTVKEALRTVPIADYAKRCGVPEDLLRAAAQRSPPRTAWRSSKTSGFSRPQQHAVLVPQQDVVDPHRELRQTRRATSAFDVRAAVRRRYRGGPNPS